MELMTGSGVKGAFLLINGGFKLFLLQRCSGPVCTQNTHYGQETCGETSGEVKRGSRSFTFTKLNLEKCFSSWDTVQSFTSQDIAG